MNHADIALFLDSVRRRSLRRDRLRAAAWAAGALGTTLLLLALAAARIGPADFWRGLTATAVVTALIAGAWLGGIRPARRLRADRAVAHVVGRAYPRVASDLVSAVELAPDAAFAAGMSPVLVRALHADVATRLAPIDLVDVVPMRPATHAGLAALAAIGVLAAAAALSPGIVRVGLATLMHRPTRFEGAAVSLDPIVGDLRLTYEYPTYTHLPPRVVEGSTGDVVAVKGTRVRLETKALRRVSRAALLLGEHGERGEIPVRVDAGRLVAEWTLLESTTYRVWLSPLMGRPVREQRAHRMEAEADRAPRVDIQGPADQLVLPAPRPIEVGYAAEDDYGLGAVDLVYRVEGRPEERVPLKDAAGARTVQGRTVWDPGTAEGRLAPGDRISYHIEARDQDAVSGAKVGSSRALTVIVQNPRDEVEERLDRQREILDRLLADLGDRLEVADGRQVRDAADPFANDRPGSVFQAMHEDEEQHVALIGGLLDADRKDGAMSKPLRAALAGVADRIGRFLRDEAALLGALRPRQGAPISAYPRLKASSDGHVPELEKDVLLLDDLISRQRLEDLAQMGRELAGMFEHLQELMKRYQATHDDGLRRQIERELRDLRARIGELQQKIAQLKARNEVSAEWQNMPDTKAVAERAKKLDELMARGDQVGLERAMAELGDALKSVRAALDANAGDFGAEAFSAENRQAAELMRKVADIEGDERDLEGATRPLADKQQAETERRLKGDLESFLKKEMDKADRLLRRAQALRPEAMDGEAAEEVERGRESARQVKRMLGSRDLAEAKAEAKRAEAGFGRAAQTLDENAAMSTPSEPGRTRQARGDLGEAGSLAGEIAADLDRVVPQASETMSPQDRVNGRSQSERQAAIAQRTAELARDAAKKASQIPNAERVEKGLRDAAERMKQASEHLGRGEAQEGHGAERDAADRLAKLREDEGKQSQMSNARGTRPPVRIPGADESKAPREWRQELLDAMKEKAPEKFRDDVRRYYEELVK